MPYQVNQQVALDRGNKAGQRRPSIMPIDGGDRGFLWLRRQVDAYSAHGLRTTTTSLATAIFTAFATCLCIGGDPFIVTIQIPSAAGIAQVRGLSDPSRTSRPCARSFHPTP
jgi:hypothetical protein